MEAETSEVQPESLPEPASPGASPARSQREMSSSLANVVDEAAEEFAAETENGNCEPGTPGPVGDGLLESTSGVVNKAREAIEEVLCSPSIQPPLRSPTAFNDEEGDTFDEGPTPFQTCTVYF